MQSFLRVSSIAGGLIAGLAIAVPSLAAEEAVHPKLQNWFTADLGGYFANTDSTISVYGPGGINPSFSVEEDLGLDDRPTLPFVHLGFRLGERWHLQADYFQLNRDGSRVIDKDITIGDTTFPINTTVSANFDTSVYRLAVGYSFLKGQHYELGASLGAHVTEFDLGISAGSVGTEATDALVPLPTVGLYGAYAFSPKWLLQGRADFFSLDYNQYSGSILDINVGLEYQVAKWLGLGAGYRYANLDLEAEYDGSYMDWVGKYEYQFSGPSLYLSLTF